MSRTFRLTAGLFIALAWIPIRAAEEPSASDALGSGRITRG